jgi:hypothetical protein
MFYLDRFCGRAASGNVKVTSTEDPESLKKKLRLVLRNKAGKVERKVIKA